MSLWCIVAGCDVTLCGSKWLCGVNWKMIWWSELHRPIPYYTVLQSTTPVLILYYKVLLQYYSVLQSTTPALLCTTKYYSSTTPSYTVLLQYYACTTKYYSSAILYYKVLLQYYTVLQSTTPVPLCTTTYYASTSLYYKVLLQYYSVLHRTTPVLLCTTKYYSSTNSVLQSTTPVLLCTTQIYTSTTLYYSVLQSTTPVLLCTTKYYSGTTPCTTLVTYETSFTMRRAAGLILQRHQIQHLPRKMTLMSDVRHIWNVVLQCAEQQVSSTNVTKYCACHEKMTRIINPRDAWNVIYNARNNRHHPSTSPNAVPATQGDSHD